MVLYVQSNPVIMTLVMQNLIYSIRYAVVRINSPLLTILLYSTVVTTLVYNDKNYSVTTEFKCM